MSKIPGVNSTLFYIFLLRIIIYLFFMIIVNRGK